MGTHSGTRRNTAAITRATAAAALLAAALVPAGTAPAAGFGPHAQRYQDSNWGGYVAHGTFRSVSGSWTEPHVTCQTADDLFAPWVGIDGDGSQTVEQTGVQTDCSSGSPQLSAWYEMYPAAPVYWNDPVDEGDHITASVTAGSGGRYTITLSDTTKGWTEHTTQYLSAGNASAEAVIESPTQSYPAFDQLDFSGVTADGQPLDAYSPEALTSGGYSPGPLNNGSFSMTPGGYANRAPHAVRPHGHHRPATIHY
ncbi:MULTISPECIES: G1 family glutamic endopeptidase [Streptomycetaceae]|uniref:Peptidase A4 family protein n=1 Tax=Streptantibioticus cattleyicolor (strain ATCC 35852 / DSM 46488 / JCM 4925 / NBRC 14057 / NRRL 8057) TaxID=1003195 RepID=F8JNW2_STREN|nr:MULTISPECIES: G1 family glutamic endopeptidase [Streptomycetaceae]AEW92697.1 hypothetical protein SCATT_03260 [Streptantibioticus cattleyicolor NRRL 8057 = DSM 46488]MYS57465.1 hypothetical protein [Streptomyces sp. SID5468]CCB73053.1 conserved exported protein of unknown function [Streptantibioticus cattleyicolor NRRL 8057 = DSM 46488]